MLVARAYGGLTGCRVGGESPPAEEVAAMGGPWRERGFDAKSIEGPRPPSERRAGVVAYERGPDRLGKVVLAYIVAVVMSFGLMLTLLHRGW
jgi:hypothetical protein